MWNDNFDFLIHSQLVFRAPVWTKKLYLSSTIDLLIMYILKSNMYLCVCVCVYTEKYTNHLFSLTKHTCITSLQLRNRTSQHLSSPLHATFKSESPLFPLYQS